MKDADEIIKSLEAACVRAGLNAVIIEPSTKIKISSPGAHARLAETITLKPRENGGAQLFFWWSWNEPICPAHEVDNAVTAIHNVVTASV